MLRWKRCRRNAPHELRQHDQAENPHILFGSDPVRANHDPGIEFAPDLYGAFPVKRLFWVVLTVFCSERERPFFVPSPGIRFAERAGRGEGAQPIAISREDQSLIRKPTRSGISLPQHPADRFVRVGPRVRIRFPPAVSLRTFGS